MASWEAFQQKPISFAVETTYLEWNTSFPAVCICENDNMERVYDVSDSIWTPQHEIDLEEVLKELAYFRGVSYYTLQYCHRPDADPMCPRGNFSFYARAVRSDCISSLTACSYNDEPFECCDFFDEIDTGVGSCFVINSVQSNNRQAERLKMINNKQTRLGLFKLDVLIPATVYTIGEEEVPDLTTLQTDYFSVVNGIRYKRHIALRSIANDELMWETRPAQRRCRFIDEDPPPIYRHYSYSACVLQCRKDAQRAFCGCVDHFMPQTSELDQCNLTGLACLNEHYGDLATLRPSWARRRGLVCDCLPSCTETDITVIKDQKKRNSNSKAATIEIVLEYLPTERYKRNLIRSRLDLVVSIGGTTGLFVGASLLSFVELVFYLTVRYYGDVQKSNQLRLANEHEMEDERLLPSIKYINDVVVVEIKRSF